MYQVFPVSFLKSTKCLYERSSCCVSVSTCSALFTSILIWKLLQRSFNVILGALANAVTASCSLEFVNTNAAKK